MVAFDLLIEDECVGVVIMRKYAIRCFNIRSQAIYIDCICIKKSKEGQGIGAGVLDALYDMVRVGNNMQESLLPCYVFAQCVRGDFWELRAHATNDARALVLQIYLMDPSKEHVYRDCTAREFQIFNENKGQSPSHA